MSLTLKARQNRQSALQAVRARQNSIFASNFGASRRADATANTVAGA